MNKAKEIAKVQSILKIPVTDLIFSPTSVAVISDGLNIGGIPYYNTAGILSYESGDNVVNWLQWSKLYDQNKTEIDKEIIALFATDKLVIGYGTFRRLYIRDKEKNLLGAVICSYTNSWFVAKQ